MTASLSRMCLHETESETREETIKRYVFVCSAAAETCLGSCGSSAVWPRPCKAEPAEMKQLIRLKVDLQPSGITGFVCFVESVCRPRFKPSLTLQTHHCSCEEQTKCLHFPKIPSLCKWNAYVVPLDITFTRLHTHTHTHKRSAATKRWHGNPITSVHSNWGQ